MVTTIKKKTSGLKSSLRCRRPINRSRLSTARKTASVECSSMLEIDLGDFMAREIHGVMGRQHRDAVARGMRADHLPHQLPAIIIKRGQGFIQDPESAI